MQSVPSGKKFYPVVDITKFVFAVFIVVLHSFQETSFVSYTPGEASGFFTLCSLISLEGCPLLFSSLRLRFFIRENKVQEHRTGKKRDLTKLLQENAFALCNLVRNQWFLGFLQSFLDIEKQLSRLANDSNAYQGYFA